MGSQHWTMRSHDGHSLGTLESTPFFLYPLSRFFLLLINDRSIRSILRISSNDTSKELLLPSKTIEFVRFESWCSQRQ